MICEHTVKRFCREYWKIKNYDQAMADTTQTWHCHHIHEIDWNLPREELIAIGRYYDVHYSELIFLTPEEHVRLHFTGENHPNYGKEGTFKGKHHTEETKAKISAAKKGENNPMYGKEGENAPNYKYHITAEELYDLYVLQGLSICKIAKMYGCNSQCIWNKLKKYSIPVRSSLEVSTKYCIPEEELYDLYVVQGLSTPKIAKIYGCGHECIRRKLKKYNIKK